MDPSRAKLLHQLISKSATASNFVHFDANELQPGEDSSSGCKDFIDNGDSEAANFLKSPSPWPQGILDAAEAAEEAETEKLEELHDVRESAKMRNESNVTDAPTLTDPSNVTETAKLAEFAESNKPRQTMPASTKAAERLLRQRFAALAKNSHCWSAAQSAAAGQANSSNVVDGDDILGNDWIGSQSQKTGGTDTATTTTGTTNPEVDDGEDKHGAAEGLEGNLLAGVESKEAAAEVAGQAKDAKGANDSQWEVLVLSDGQKQSRSAEEPQTSNRSLCSADKPIHIMNLPSTFADGNLQYPAAAVDGIADHLHQQSHQLFLHQLPHPRQTSRSSMVMSAPKKPVVGNTAGSDISHLALDCRDLANYHDMNNSATLNALCRWCLRRVFRADWSRDCYLCDLPLTHSCLMCFCALHAPPEHEATRSYNAVVCSTMRTSCSHVYHRHCWTRWEEELSPCCPKCNTANIAKNVKETFIIEKRCK